MARDASSLHRRSKPRTSVGGACLCGAVAFTIEPPYRWFAHCHCSMCRKHHGSLFSTGLGVARAALGFESGVETIVHYRASQAFERPFCRVCGSTIPGISHDENFWNVPAGLLASDPGARPRSHIFVASRSPLTTLDVTLPRHAAYPPGIDLPSVAARPTPHTSAAIAGGCLCGAVAFEVAALPRGIVHCHCSKCRRSRAAAFGSTLRVPRTELHFVRGAAHLRRFALAAPWHYTTAFCSECGSLLPSDAPHAPASALIPVGAVDTPLPPLPAVHCWVESKAHWDEIVDAWPQHAALPPAEELAKYCS